METPKSPPRRCAACGKHVYDTQATAIQTAMRLRVDSGLYRTEYRCPGDPLGGWHLRDLRKRYEKVKNHNGREADELREKIKRLDLLVPEDARVQAQKSAHDRPVENALRKLQPGKPKPVGRRGQLRRARRDHTEGGEARVGGTRGTAVNNELRRKQERARLREELRREEKE